MRILSTLAAVVSLSALAFAQSPLTTTFANNNGNCDEDSDSWFCIGRAVTIQAAEPGAVELDAMGQRRVLHITCTEVQLIGLNITGGLTDTSGGLTDSGNVRACAS